MSYDTGNVSHDKGRLYSILDWRFCACVTGVTFVVCGGLATSHASGLATAVLGSLVCATLAAVQLYWRAGCH